jgi:hypothetical protein
MMPKDHAEVLVEELPEVPLELLLPPQPISKGFKAVTPAPAVATIRKRRRETPVGCATSSFFLSNMDISQIFRLCPPEKTIFHQAEIVAPFIFQRTEERRRRRNAHPLPSIFGVKNTV